MRRVKASFGFDWHEGLEKFVARMIDDEPRAVIDDLGRLLERIRELDAAGRWGLGRPLGVGVIMEKSGPMYIWLEGTPPAKNEVPMREVLPSGELGPVRIAKWDAPPPPPATPEVHRQRLVQRILVNGSLCRCGEIADATDGKRPCKGDGVKGLRLPDGSKLRCGSDVTDMDVAAVNLLLQPLPHYLDAIRRGDGSASVKGVLEKEEGAIKQARLDIGLSRSRRGRPQRRETSR
jgi:hypothetical protein